MPESMGERARSPFVPITILALAFLIWLAFQTMQLFMERNELAGARSSQATLVENSKKLRAALDTLAAGTQGLADGGNANARVVVEELRRRGVTINPNSAGNSPIAK